ncbi:anthranilate synthase component I [Endozoicomonas sp. SM1973]|uniref:Anthranilate synthase component 1 n=1 Tax=Spartinivicinus marinus TaxID=2994442 RepID=A0A853I9B1_9GAMM|nr:anthranilate synthase component I [Spartinivicinus marinus]MCX4028032.1 anthranilate synthase component I [Spartinivicinus marinus]NYZ68342.1 anthranilate synthase component I [Spartinivicinus marinus]
MTPEQFSSLAAAGYNRIPVTHEVLADLDTPLSTYLKLANQPFSYLLESVQGGEKWGRYSIIGLPAKEQILVTGFEIKRYVSGQLVETRQEQNPLNYIADYQAQFKVPQLPGLPRFFGGLVGYFAYDTVRYIEPKLQKTTPPDELNTPDIFLMLSEEVVIFDNLTGKILFVVMADPSQTESLNSAKQRLHELVETLHSKPFTAPTSKQKREVTEADFKSSVGQEKFEASVAKVKEYILAGDAMQVVLSQRMTVPFHSPPLNLYRALRCLNPSPYMYYLDLGEFHVVGSSPEILAHVEDGQVTVRPIAGTRKRGKTEEQDLALEKELLADPKELAEHLMLIDLGRNDVGRVAQTGTVKLTDQMVIERYSHVMHIVSNVIGQVKEDLSALDVLKATLPAGTLSGAPKVRAMEIIDELETTKRGVYGGAVGYLSWHGNMDTAIAIRTAVIKNHQLYIQAGAGVVADSDPSLEWKETLNKGRAMFSAVAMAEKGLVE